MVAAGDCVEATSIGGADEDEDEGEGEGEEGGGEEAVEDGAGGAGDDGTLLDEGAEPAGALVVPACATVDVTAGA